MPPFSPAISTSAHAVPSGYGRVSCSLTINALLSGIINKTPRTPPASARIKIWKYLKYAIPPGRKSKAGIVKTTPAATDSPAEPMVCTILFSRIVAFPNFLKTEIAKTAIGIEALTVIPTFNPRYTDEAPNMMPKMPPSIIALIVNSGIVSEAGI